MTADATRAANDPSDDYGYDLAHEVPAGPDAHRPRSGHARYRPQARPVDPYSDYGFDEAHDL